MKLRNTIMALAVSAAATFGPAENGGAKLDHGSAAILAVRAA